MSEPADIDARRRILTEFGTTFFVEAAAGTGKTTALVGRIVGLVKTGTGRLEQIVAVTFTEKAAGEMKLRLRSEIEKERAQATNLERDRLDQALEELELARIGTIHGFCGDILHERPIEAGIDPLFEVASEEEAEAIANEAFDRWFEKVLADPPEGIRRVLRRRSSRQRPREAYEARTPIDRSASLHLQTSRSTRPAKWSNLFLEEPTLANGRDPARSSRYGTQRRRIRCRLYKPSGDRGAEPPDRYDTPKRQLADRPLSRVPLVAIARLVRSRYRNREGTDGSQRRYGPRWPVDARTSHCNFAPCALDVVRE